MRIAWVTYDFEEYSAHHVNALCVDHDVLLAIPHDEAKQLSFDSRIAVYDFHKPRMRQPWKQLVSIRRLLQQLDEFSPDVVHFQQGHLWFNFALPLLKRRYPLVITIHDPRHHEGDRVSQKTPQWVLDFGFRRGHHVIVHGTALAEEVESLFGFPRERIHVIPHVAMGGQTAIPSQNAILTADPGVVQEYGQRSKRVLFFGRIWDYKGLDTLIAAEPLITEKFPEARIVIAGTGDDFAKYHKLIKHPEHFEIHHRWISDQERAEFFQAADLVVLPYNEATQSGVVPVAYNYQKPVVATRVGALSDCVLDGKTGLLVPPRDPPTLAAAIIELLGDESRCRSMGMAGYAYLQEFMSPVAVAAATAHVYHAACQSSQERTVPCVE